MVKVGGVCGGGGRLKIKKNSNQDSLMVRTLISCVNGENSNFSLDMLEFIYMIYSPPAKINVSSSCIIK